MTTLTVTEPLKEHLFTIKQIRGLTSLNDTVQSILEDPIDDDFQIEQGNMDENPATVKISDITLSWLKERKKQSEFEVYEDMLRDLSGASPRSQGEEPIEWEPL